jgi:hypothetical protein
MASGQSLVVNDNIYTKNTEAIDSFIEPHIFMNKLLRYRRELEKNMTTIDIDSRYNYRPDRLAFELYGQDFWYPAILVVNNLGSILQFKADVLNFKCKVPSIDIIKKILNAPEVEHITVDGIINEMFK